LQALLEFNLLLFSSQRPFYKPLQNVTSLRLIQNHAMKIYGEWREGSRHYSSWR